MASPNSQSLISESSIVTLIEEVEKRPALYKKNLKEYSDINVKKRLWEEANPTKLSADKKSVVCGGSKSWECLGALKDSDDV
ncbi:hypothetical protein B5X24_HaOG203621 [Helicoverpa armigera]|uniref:MADF domain-containing protein n=1 Tax=Helicoverpa armigera TaxID=29058 RepID=A0A2W1BUA1_HELAM|nr:hypothetical protein B5X24_HaOG203621 [Helicoverpa armigera]